MESVEPASATVGLRELRQNASHYLSEVAQGQTFVVTVQGRPVGELGPHRSAWRRSGDIRGLFGTPSDPDALAGGLAVDAVDPWEQV